MSTSIVPANVQLPAHLANKLGAPSALNSSIGGGLSSGVSIPRISIKGGRFRIMDGGVETVLQDLNLDVVIVGANPGITKLWFENAWTPDSESVGPDCYSMDGVRPATDSRNQQSNLCATCPQNVWGSKITPQGGKIKACADHKRLAVVAANDPTGPIYLLQVTPAALKGLNQYHKELSMRGIPAEIVRTKVSFDTSASFPKLNFGFGGFIDEDTLMALQDVLGSERVREVTGEEEMGLAPIQIEVAKPVLVKEVAKPVKAEPPAPPAASFGKPAATPAPVAAKPVKAEPPAAVAVPTGITGDDITKLLEDMNFNDDEAN